MKNKRLCRCPLVNKIHYVSAHKKAHTLAGMKKSTAYRVGLLAGLEKARMVITALIEETEDER